MATAATKAIEQSTYVITTTFTDESGDEVTPDSVKWSLVDRDGEIINNREQEEISAEDLSAEIDIVLAGDDLAIESGRSEEKRWLVVEAVYTSTLGSDLPLTQEYEFSVVNLKYIE